MTDKDMNSLGRLEVLASFIAGDATTIEAACKSIHWPNWRTRAEAELERAEVKLVDALAAVRRARESIKPAPKLVAAE